MVEKILNGDFSQTTNNADDDPLFWDITETNSFSVSTGLNFFDRLVFNQGQTPVGGIASQTVSDVTIGHVVNFSAEFLDNGGGGNPQVLIEILDGNGLVIFSQIESTPDTIVSTTFSATTTSYTISFTDVSSGNLTSHDAHIDNVSFDVICFCSGTEIETRQGPRVIEKLVVGDEIFTIDNGYQQIRWIGSVNLDAIDLAASSKLLPIRVVSGALGSGLPTADLMVSRQHRMLVRSAVAKRMFGQNEVLISACKLLPLDGVDIVEDAQLVTYWHILFDRHEVVLANGAPSESLYTGPEALNAVSNESRAEIVALFPELEQKDYRRKPVRLIPAKGTQVKRFVARVEKNKKHLLELVD